MDYRQTNPNSDSEPDVTDQSQELRATCLHPEDVSSSRPHQSWGYNPTHPKSNYEPEVTGRRKLLQDSSTTKMVGNLNTGVRQRHTNKQSERLRSEKKSRSFEEDDEDEEEKASNSIYSSNNLTLGMMIVCLIAVTVVYGYYRQSETSTSPPLFDLYKSELVKMKAKYLNQSTRFWTTFLSSLEPILTTDDPDLPAVIMLAVPENQHSMGLCFVEHLAEILNNLLVGEETTPLKLSYIDGSRLTKLNGDEQKLKIDEKIRKIITENKQRVIIVDSLEKLNPKSVIIFHGYCDNSEAVFKNIAIVFLLVIPEESNYTSDEQVYAHLFHLWNELGNGKTKALLARMANNVAIMQKVNHFMC